ncbi:MAG: hypothetical protein U0Z53_15755 [Blastocatellia bacterium]
MTLNRPVKEIPCSPLQHLPSYRRWLTFAFLFLLSGGLLLTSACRSLFVRSDTSIPRLATPLAQEDFDSLKARLTQFTEMSALRTQRVLLQFFDTQSAERLPAADAILVFQRPDRIRLRLQYLSAKVADMVSESNHFKVAIYRPEEYRRFLIGTNDADYSRMRAKLEKKEQQSALLNARPFHFTDALLMRPLHFGDARFIYSLEESLIEEPDTRKGAKKGARMWHSFYVITELETAAQPGAPARVRRRFWFDRLNQAQFVRQQLFDEQGQVATEVEYSNYGKLSPESNQLWPGVILVSRPRDNYAARLTFTMNAESYVINPDLSEARPFVLENEEGLPETNLDKQSKPESDNP